MPFEVEEVQVGVIVHGTEFLVKIGVPGQIQLALTVYIYGEGSNIVEVDVDLAGFLIKGYDTGRTCGQVAAVKVGGVGQGSIRREGYFQIKSRALLGAEEGQGLHGWYQPGLLPWWSRSQAE